MGLVTWLKRLFSGPPQKTALKKPRPHKVVRNKGQTAQKKLSDMAAKQNGRNKIASS
jgi:hypothetical protein